MLIFFPAPCRLAIPVIFLLGLSGCGGRFEAAPLDPKAVTDAAMQQYDTNGDRFLDLDELVASPGLLDALFESDLNADKKISLEELGVRLENMYGRGISILSVDCKVTLKGRPLKGASVLFVPEEFLGKGTTMPAEGTTNEVGLAVIAIPAEKLPEGLRKYKKVQAGMYRVEITHPTVKIPARYNTNTELGFEVHPDAHGGNRALFELKSR